jgi:hypothetical protein
MAKHKGQNSDEQLESYLTNDFHLEIYEELTDGDRVGLFEPLEFFDLLYSQYKSVKDNKTKPLTVIKTLKQLKLTDKQRHCLFYYLNALIQKVNSSGGEGRDKQLEICASFIEKEIYNLEEVLADEAEAQPAKENRFDFDKVKQHLETLPDTESKLKYLVEIQTEYEQEESSFFRNPFDRFSEKCELEIAKLNQLMILERPKSSQTGAETDSTNRNPEYTTARQVLATYFLLEYAKANCPNTAKADFIAFLTSKSRERIRQFLSGLYQSKDENYTKWEKDMKYVRKHF